jgi:hypothetical protein
MGRIIATARLSQRLSPLEILRSMIVCSCALALIAAGQTLPF